MKKKRKLKERERVTTNWKNTRARLLKVEDECGSRPANEITCLGRKALDLPNPLFLWALRAKSESETGRD